MRTAMTRGLKLATCVSVLIFAAVTVAANDQDNDDQQQSSSQDRDNAKSDRAKSDRSDQSSDQEGKKNEHRALGVTLNEDAAGNLYVRRVFPNSPADEAGLRQGDEILSVDGQRVSHPDELKRALARASEDTVELAIFRNGRNRTLQATLASPEEAFGRNRGNDMANAGGRRRGQRRGYSYVPADQRPALGVTLDPNSIDGAWVLRVFPDSPAAEAGIKPGDEILAIDGQDIASADDLMWSLARKQPGDEIELDIDHRGEERTVQATLESQNMFWTGRVRSARRNQRSNGSSRGGQNMNGGGRNDNRSNQETTY